MNAKLVIYSRPGCHLCDVMKDQLRDASKKVQFELQQINIDQDESLLKLYGESIPVLTINGKLAFKGRMKLEEFYSKFHRILEGSV